MSGMVEVTERYETVDGCRVHTLRGGVGPTLLFLHGGGGAGTWLPFHEKLAQRFHVIVPEHPGFGRSERPEWADNVGDMAMFYLDFIQALGLKDVNLVGTSLGGWIAADLATRSTADLKSLTLIAPAGLHVSGVEKGDIFLWTPEETAKNMFVNQAMSQAYLDRPSTPDDDFRATKNAEMLAKLVWSPRLFSHDLPKWLHRIDVPTLIVWGDSDKVLAPGHGPAFQQLIKGSRLETIKDCGHLPHIEQSDALVQLIEGFAS
jgi:pimeloyl-ACP methyl ester carboxylesterase